MFSIFVMKFDCFGERMELFGVFLRMVGYLDNW